MFSGGDYCYAVFTDYVKHDDAGTLCETKGGSMIQLFSTSENEPMANFLYSELEAKLTTINSYIVFLGLTRATGI